MTTLLPHHRLHAYVACRALLDAVVKTKIRDTKLRDEALRAAKGACLNTAEGAGRVARADKAHFYAMARGSALEAAAAVEIAAAAGDCAAADAARVLEAAAPAIAMLTKLARR